MGSIINIEKFINQSAVIACKIEDKDTRIRTYALNIAAYAATEALNGIGLHTEIKDSLFRITSFCENFELADVYTNGFRLDVRVTFDGKTFTIPKTHQKYEAVPYAYLVVKLDEKNKQAELLGFVDTKTIEYDKTDSPYYYFNTEILTPVENLEDFLNSLEIKDKPCSANELEKIKELCAAFIDEEISESEKVFFIKHVISCSVCRKTFCLLSGFDSFAKQIKNYEELLNDSTLSVLSGNKKEFDEAALANMSLVENAQEDTKQTEELEELTNAADETPVLEEVSSEPLAADEDSDINEESQTDEEIIPVSEPDIELPSEEEPLILEESANEELLLEADSDNDTPEQNAAAEDLILSETEQLKEDELLPDTKLEDLEELAEENEPQEELSLNDTELPELADESESQELLTLEEDNDFAQEDTLIDNSAKEEEEEEEIQQILNTDNDQEELLLADDDSALELLAEPENIDEEETLAELPSEGLSLVEDNDDEIPVLQEEPENIDEQINTNPAEHVNSQPEEQDIDTIKPVDSAEETDGLQIDAQDNTQQEEPQYVMPELDDTAEELNAYATQEPVELNYDEETENNDTDSPEYQIHQAPDNQYIYNTDNDIENAGSTTEDTTSLQENPEIQSLLDDDLMAILGNKDDEDTSVQQTINETAQNYEEPPVQYTANEQEYTQDENNNTQESGEIDSLFENNETPQTQNGENSSFELAQEPVSAETVKKTKKLDTNGISVFKIPVLNATFIVFLSDATSICSKFL